MDKFFTKKNKVISKKRIEYEDGENSKKSEREIRAIDIDIGKSAKQSKVTIDNIEIFFPFPPYENQVIYMTKVIQALNKKTVAGLESPTGTGKTLCLLCACLGWLRAKRSDILKGNCKDIEECPRIYYSSRTHSQLSGVIKELKKTCYLPRTAILSSRDNMCVHNVIKNFKGNALNVKCKQARHKKECKFFYGSERLPCSSYDNADIEELYQSGLKSCFCPFFFQRKKKDDADIIFLPYNYIFEPQIKNSLKLHLDNSILIIDEAHNIESVCEDAISCQLSVKIIDEVLTDLKAIKTLVESSEDTLGKESIFSTINPENITEEELILTSIKTYLKSFTIKSGKFWPDVGLKLSPKELFDIFYEGSKGKDRQQSLLLKNKTTEGLEPNNLNIHIDLLKKIELGLSEELQKSSIIVEYIQVLSLIKVLSDNYLSFIQSSDTNPLSNYCNNYKFFINDIEDASPNFNYGNKKNNYNNMKVRTLFLYCFNPGFGFKEIFNENLQSVIITSGTLSPLEGVESELKCSFGIKLENKHVIDNAQISFTLLTNSLRKKDLQFRFDNQNKGNVSMIEELGYTISELCKLARGGILVFFTSFSFMNTCTSIWAEKEILSEIEQSKEIFKDMHDSQKNKVVLKNFTDANRNCSKGKGAIMFSVFRGTTSEGIDFSDDFARMVILVGIPYPNLGDVRVQMKKEFLDEFNKKHFQFVNDKTIRRLSGSEWYTQAATRTVNQALGRVIRHIDDYGSMVLLDARFRDLLYRKMFSSWLRDSARVYSDNKILYDINYFFEKMKTYINTKAETKKLKTIDEYEKKYNRESTTTRTTGFIQADRIYNNNNRSTNIRNDNQIELIGINSLPVYNNAQKGNSINISTTLIKNGKLMDKPSNVIEEKIINERQMINEPIIEAEDVLANLNQDELMEFLNENFNFDDEEDEEKSKPTENIESIQIAPLHQTPKANFIQLKSESKSNSSKKKIMKKVPTPTYIPLQQNDNISQISFDHLITPIKKSTIDIQNDNNDNNGQSKEIQSEAIIKKLLELKDRSELCSLLEKYNLKLDFESNPKQEKEKTPLSKRIECPVCFDNSQENKNFAKCGHVLCNSCWRKCLNEKMECPMCKKKVRNKTLIHLFIN